MQHILTELLTRRDVIALEAMKVILRQCLHEYITDKTFPYPQPIATAEEAYRYADGMLEVREDHHAEHGSTPTAGAAESLRGARTESEQGRSFP